MTSHRLRERIDSLFVEAIELPEDQRVSFIESRTSDDEPESDDAHVRASVLKLLDADQRVETSFAARGPLNLKNFTAENIPDPRIGQQIGEYTIQSRIASGGFGTVYLATREKPYHEEVAIKLIHPSGLVEPAIVQRVLREMQALSDLRHANIVTQLHANVTEQGEPYIVMERIDGLPLDEFCDQQQLSINERMQLFQKVCGAVEFAHEHGWVHRDLKPSNILVTSDGTPKLLDFGIAKLVHSDVAAGETLTLAPVGTPQYMSPEQFRGETSGKATDIYALGAILYELISGHRAFDVMCDGVDAVIVEAIRRAVCETIPKRPSTVVASETRTSTGASIQDVAHQRAASPASLKRCLQGDVDNIAMMALRKEPERRYASAAAVSEDIQRWLEHRPVAARPDSMPYRVKKFLRRNRVALSVVATLVVAFGLTAAVWTSRDRALQSRDRIAKSRDIERATRYIESAHASINEDNIPKAVEHLRTALELSGDDPLTDSVSRLLAGWNRYLGEPLGTLPNARYEFSRNSKNLAALEPESQQIRIESRNQHGGTHLFGIGESIVDFGFTPNEAKLVVATESGTLLCLAVTSPTTRPAQTKLATAAVAVWPGNNAALCVSQREGKLELVEWNYSSPYVQTIATTALDQQAQHVDVLTENAIALISRPEDAPQRTQIRDRNLNLIFEHQADGFGSRVTSPDGSLIGLNFRHPNGCVVMESREGKHNPREFLGSVLAVTDGGELLLMRNQQLVLANLNEDSERVLRSFEGRWNAAYRNDGQIVAAEVLMAPRLHVRLWRNVAESSSNSIRLFPGQQTPSDHNFSSTRDRCTFDPTGGLVLFDHKINDGLAKSRIPWMWKTSPFLLERIPPPNIDDKIRFVGEMKGHVVAATRDRLLCWREGAWQVNKFESSDVTAFACSSDAEFLIGDANGFAHWVDVLDLKVVETSPVANQPLRSLAMCDEHVIAATQSQVMYRSKLIAQRDDAFIHAVRGTSRTDGHVLVGTDKEVQCVNSNGKVVRSLRIDEFESRIYDFAETDSGILAVTIERGQARVIGDGVSGSFGEATSCTSIAIRADGQVAVVGYDDGGLRFWDVPTRRPLSRRLRAGEDSISQLSFSGDARRVVSISDSQEISRWDADF